MTLATDCGRILTNGWWQRGHPRRPWADVARLLCFSMETACWALLLRSFNILYCHLPAVVCQARREFQEQDCIRPLPDRHLCWHWGNSLSTNPNHNWKFIRSLIIFVFLVHIGAYFLYIFDILCSTTLKAGILKLLENFFRKLLRISFRRWTIFVCSLYCYPTWRDSRGSPQTGHH